MSIEPDTKNWTWVLERPCPECRFDAATVVPGDVPDRLRATTGVWSQVLRRDDAQDRPRPSVWSPLEYACHVRDVLRLFDERLRLMLDGDDPLFADWDQDATAVALRYGEQDPARVTEEVAAAGEQLAGRFAGVGMTVWSRTSRRSDGAHFTVASFAAYLLHDLEHHEVDVRPGSTR